MELDSHHIFNGLCLPLLRKFSRSPYYHGATRPRPTPRPTPLPPTTPYEYNKRKHLTNGQNNVIMVP